MGADIFTLAAVVASPLLGSGIVAWLMQRSFRSQDAKATEQGELLKNMSKRMDCFESSQHACQLDNERRFSTWERHREISATVKDHETRITRLETKSQ